MITATKTTWKIAGEEAGGCNCAWGCPCQFNSLPTHGRCEGFVGIQIHEGYFGKTRLDGVKFARVFWWPGAVHEGNGTRQMIIDNEATRDQRDALMAIESGSHGGTIFEIFVAVCPNIHETLISPIRFETDREKRKARVHVSGIGEFQAEPIRNPVTGEEHRARIVLPDGFEYKEAEVANSVAIQVTGREPLIFDHKDTYAQLNAFDWSNT